MNQRNRLDTGNTNEVHFVQVVMATINLAFHTSARNSSFQFVHVHLERTVIGNFENVDLYQVSSRVNTRLFSIRGLSGSMSKITIKSN